MFEFIPPAENVRDFREEFSVRLGDADVAGQLRLDGVARFLQDVATDDWDETGIESTDTWVVRRTSLRIAEGGRWPRYKERLTLSTWCAGVGAAWAERRTNVMIGSRCMLEAEAIWVPIDQTGHPVRLRTSFFDVYGESVRERKVSGRVPRAQVSDGALRQPWPLRRADLDIVGHVNNAAVWQAVTEVVAAPVSQVSVIHHAPIESGHDVTLLHSPGAMWLEVDGTVAVSATYSP